MRPQPINIRHCYCCWAPRANKCLPSCQSAGDVSRSIITPWHIFSYFPIPYPFLLQCIYAVVGTVRVRTDRSCAGSAGNSARTSRPAIDHPPPLLQHIHLSTNERMDDLLWSHRTLWISIIVGGLVVVSLCCRTPGRIVFFGGGREVVALKIRLSSAKQRFIILHFLKVYVVFKKRVQLIPVYYTKMDIL